MLSIAAAASSCSSNSTNAKPLCASKIINKKHGKLYMSDVQITSGNLISLLYPYEQGYLFTYGFDHDKNSHK